MNLKEFLLTEAIDPKLAALIKDFGLKSNLAGTLIDDFSFTEKHKQAFDDAGFTIQWNDKKGKFVVAKKLSDKEQQDKAAKQEFANKDISGRKVGFKPYRKMM